MKWAIAALCAAMTVLLTAPRGGAHEVVASIGDKIHSKQAEIDSTRKRLEQKRGLLRFQEVRAQDLQRQLAGTDRKRRPFTRYAYGPGAFEPTTACLEPGAAGSSPGNLAAP